MTKYRITGEMLRHETGITTSEAAKINKDTYMTLQSLERIVKYLSKKLSHNVGIDNIVTIL